MNVLRKQRPSGRCALAGVAHKAARAGLAVIPRRARAILAPWTRRRPYAQHSEEPDGSHLDEAFEQFPTRVTSSIDQPTRHPHRLICSADRLVVGLVP